MNLNEARYISCITNQTAGIHSCTIKGEHTQACTGSSRTGAECRGCLPRPAQHGLLCWDCWENLIAVETRWDEFITALDGVDRAVQRDNAGVRGSATSYIGLTNLWMDIHACLMLRKSLTGMLDEWVSRVPGAQDAVKFIKEARQAFNAHPIQELPHRLKRQRCPKCSQLTLVWMPPEFEGDQVRVVCSDIWCDREMDQRSFETLAAIEGRAS